MLDEDRNSLRKRSVFSTSATLRSSSCTPPRRAVITGAEVVSTDGQGHGALVGFLVRNGVNVLLCGGIGGGAQMALAQAGIRLCGGITGDAGALRGLSCRHAGL